MKKEKKNKYFNINKNIFRKKKFMKNIYKQWNKFKYKKKNQIKEKNIK